MGISTNTPQLIEILVWEGDLADSCCTEAVPGSVVVFSSVHSVVLKYEQIDRKLKAPLPMP